MDRKNLQYLKDNLLYLGFGRDLYPEIQKNMEQRFPEFVLRHQALVNDKPFSGVLYFKKEEEGDHYFFNRWDASLKNGDTTRTQTFYLQKGYGVTFKEAFNLLEGRAVYKTLFKANDESYGAWLQLDLRAQDGAGNYRLHQYHERYGYQLEKTLRRFPIQELEREADKRMLLYQLQKGNRALVTMEGGGRVERLWVEAVPQFKMLNIYDYQGVPLHLSTLAQRFSSGQKSDIKKAVAPGEQDTTAQKRKWVQAPKKGSTPKWGKGQTLF